MAGATSAVAENFGAGIAAIGGGGVFSETFHQLRALREEHDRLLNDVEAVRTVVEAREAALPVEFQQSFGPIGDLSEKARLQEAIAKLSVEAGRLARENQELREASISTHAQVVALEARTGLQTPPMSPTPSTPKTGSAEKPSKKDPDGLDSLIVGHLQDAGVDVGKILAGMANNEMPSELQLAQLDLEIQLLSIEEQSQQSNASKWRMRSLRLEDRMQHNAARQAAIEEELRAIGEELVGVNKQAEDCMAEAEAHYREASAWRQAVDDAQYPVPRPPAHDPEDEE
uniref:Uncharacterized protein n=1 Tax=Oxyrrhis marina TaxID=2969 RepID=A0A7S4GQ09_OXYMA